MVNKNFENNVIINGTLMELGRIIRGTSTKTGKDYISFTGRVLTSDDEFDTHQFKVFVNSTVKDGSPSKMYHNVTEWLETAKAGVNVGRDNATKVNLTGTLTDNAYVNKEGVLVEGFRGTNVSVKFINDYTNDENKIQLGGYIKSFTEEIGPDGESTGRLKMELISKDNFGTVLDIPDIIIPADLVPKVKKAGWEEGATVEMVTFKYAVTKVASTDDGWFGEEEGAVSNKRTRELIVTGGRRAYSEDSPLSLTEDEINELLKERAAYINNIKSEGYKGSAQSSATTVSSSKKTGNTSPRKIDDDIDDGADF